MLTGHFILLCGGTSVAALPHLDARMNAMTDGPPTELLLLDCDQRSEQDAKRYGVEFLDITTPYNDITTYLAEPELLSPVAREILMRYKPNLTPVSLHAGAGTRRYLCQFFLENARERVLEQLKRQLMRLRRQGVTQVQTHILAGDGGGSGSSLAVTLPHLLAEPTVQQSLHMGCNGLLLMPPVIWLCDVSCHARHSKEPQKFRIPANRYFTHIGAQNLLDLRGADNNPLASIVVPIGAGSQWKFFENIDEIVAEAAHCLSTVIAYWDQIGSTETDFIFADPGHSKLRSASETDLNEVGVWP